MDKRRRNSEGIDEKATKGTASYSSRILSWFSSGEDKSEELKGKKKIPIRIVELPVDIINNGYSQDDLDAAIEKEGKMIAEDKLEKERIDAKNALEEYVYDLRAQLANDEQLAVFVTENDRKTLNKLLQDTENWLYEDGENCQRHIYSDRLSKLKMQGEPIKIRKLEFEGRETAQHNLGNALQLAKKEIDQIRQSHQAKEDTYSHITEEDIKKVEKTIQEKWQWLEEKRSILARTPRTEQAPITIAEIDSEKEAFNSTVTPILRKTKPKPELSTDKTKEKNAEELKNSQNNQADGQNNSQLLNEDKMDVE